MNDTGPGTGMTPRRQAVMDKLRQRFGQYRKRHIDCQNKYAQSLPARENMERQEAMSLHKRALDSRHRNLINMNVKGRQSDGKGKGEQPPNGLEKSTTAILQQQILKRKRDQSLNNSPGHSYAATSEDSNQSSERLSKYQRQDDIHPLHDGVLLQAPSTQQENSNSTSGSVHQVDHSTQPSGHASTFPGRNSPFVREGSMNSSLISNQLGAHGSDTFSNGTQGLSPSSFPPPDFKQEKAVSVSCEGSIHSSSVSGSLVNGLDQGPCPDSKLNLPAGDFLQQELKYFDIVVKSFAVENTSGSQQPIQQGGVIDGPSIPGCEDGIRNQGPETQLRVGRQSQNLQLLARQSQLAQVQQGGPFMDSQDHQYQRQQPPQFTMGCVSQPTSGLQHPYSTSKYTAAIPQMSAEQQQMFQDFNQPEVSIAGGFSRQLQYQRALSSPASQHSLYGFTQDSLATAKLSHMPSQLQPQIYPQKFQTRPGMPTSQGPVSVRPMTSLDVAARYSMPPHSQLQYQRQSSMPPLQGQTFVNSESPYQQQVRGFQAVEPAFSAAADLANSYHYQRRNSFPLYQRTNGQPHGNFPQGMPQGMGASQANLLRGVLQASTGIPGEREAFMMNPNMGLPSSTAMQSGLQLGGRTPSANGDLNTGVPRSQNSTVMYRGSLPRQQSTPVLQQGGDFQGSSNVRKPTAPDNSYQVFPGVSVALGDMSERHSAAANNDAQYSGYSPLGVLDKAPSFTSLLEQSAISPGNLETTYTGSIPNLDLLGEILGQ